MQQTSYLPSIVRLSAINRNIGREFIGNKGNADFVVTVSTQSNYRLNKGEILFWTMDPYIGLLYAL